MMNMITITVMYQVSLVGVFTGNMVCIWLIHLVIVTMFAVLNCNSAFIGIEQKHDGGAVMIQTYSNATFDRYSFTENQTSGDGFRQWRIHSCSQVNL